MKTARLLNEDKGFFGVSIGTVAGLLFLFILLMKSKVLSPLVSLVLCICIFMACVKLRNKTREKIIRDFIRTYIVRLIFRGNYVVNR